MPVRTLTIYRGCLGDDSPSMEVYGDRLVEAFERLAPETFRVRQSRPRRPVWGGIRPLRRVAGRYARYVAAPRAAARVQGDVNHILDQTYAHLLTAVDPARTVVTVHDLIPLLAWEGSVPGLTYPHYPYLYKRVVSHLRRSGAVVAVSESTKRDVERLCGLSGRDVTVVHNGIDPLFRPAKDSERLRLRASLGLPGAHTHLVLVTGGQRYKNHGTSFQVVGRLRQTMREPVELVWFGTADRAYELELERLVPGLPVHRIGGLAVERLAALYNSVDCLLFPSWYEGFGWPPVEAMACGTPVVISSTPALVEVCGEAALTAPADDVAGLASAVRTLLEDAATRADRVRRGLECASRFTWTKCATELLEVYERVSETGD